MWADILIALFIVLAMVPFYLAGRAHGQYLANRRLDEPEAYGDQGGMPTSSKTPAPDTGSGLLAGDKPS